MNDHLYLFYIKYIYMMNSQITIIWGIQPHTPYLHNPYI